MNSLPQKHITEIIEEALHRRVKKTIQEYADKNAAAFTAHRIAGIQFELRMNVLVDNLGLLPPKPSLLKRFLNAFKTFFSKKAH